MKPCVRVQYEPWCSADFESPHVLPRTLQVTRNNYWTAASSYNACQIWNSITLDVCSYIRTHLFKYHLIQINSRISSCPGATKSKQVCRCLAFFYLLFLFLIFLSAITSTFLLYIYICSYEIYATSVCSKCNNKCTHVCWSSTCCTKDVNPVAQPTASKHWRITMYLPFLIISAATSVHTITEILSSQFLSNLEAFLDLRCCVCHYVSIRVCAGTTHVPAMHYSQVRRRRLTHQMTHVNAHSTQFTATVLQRCVHSLNKIRKKVSM